MLTHLIRAIEQFMNHTFDTILWNRANKFPSRIDIKLKAQMILQRT
jgi:hypothetical protein